MEYFNNCTFNWNTSPNDFAQEKIPKPILQPAMMDDQIIN